MRIEKTFVTRDVLSKAGEIHLKYGSMLLADSILLADGFVRDAIVVTSDHKELEKVDLGEDDLKFLWFRDRIEKKGAGKTKDLNLF
jgi:hypothetical protein